MPELIMNRLILLTKLGIVNFEVVHHLRKSNDLLSVVGC